MVHKTVSHKRFRAGVNVRQSMQFPRPLRLLQSMRVEQDFVSS